MPDVVMAIQSAIEIVGRLRNLSKKVGPSAALQNYLFF
jgi:hypothetical protein